MRTVAVRPTLGWIAHGSEVDLPFGALRVMDDAELSEGPLRARKGRMRLNAAAPLKACLEGRLNWDGYGLVKAHASINPSDTQFTIECAVRLPKITVYPTANSVYPLLFRGGTTARTVYAIYLFSTGSAVQVRADFTEVTAAGATVRTLTYALPTTTEGTVYNVALRRGGTAGGTATLVELVVNGTVQASRTIPAATFFYGSDTGESNLPASIPVGDRALMDLFVLNKSPDFAWSTLYQTPMQEDPRLSEARFWSRARTDAELSTWGTTELSTAQAADANLAGYWPLNAGGGRYETNKSATGAAGAVYVMPFPPTWRVSSQLEFVGRDHLLRVPYIAAYARVASQDLSVAVKTWTWMLRFTTGSYLQNYVSDSDTNDNRRMVLLQWGDDPTTPQARLSVLKSGANYNLVWESYHNATLSTLTSSTNLAAATTYTVWIARNGRSLLMYRDDGTSSVAGSATQIAAADSTYGTGVTTAILVGAGVASAANEQAYNHEKFFFGTIDEIRLYAREVEQDVRVKTYAADLSQADIEADPDLLLCVPFADGIGRFAADKSKTANVGLLTRNYYHSATTQWSSKRPVRWRAGFVTPQGNPSFNLASSYVKRAATTETIVGVAGGIAYEADPTAATLTALNGDVAPDEVNTRPYSSTAVGNRLYFADGRNPVAAIEGGVVRPCGIADLPASAVPGIEIVGPGALLGYYAFAVRIKSAFTGARSRLVKTAGVRFRNERALVGYDVTKPGAQYYAFDGSTQSVTLPGTAAYFDFDDSWSFEVLARARAITTERGESRNLRFNGTSDFVATTASLGSWTTNKLAQPPGDFTYEVRFQWVATGLAKYVFCHSNGVTSTSFGTCTIRSNAATATTLEILNGTTVLFSVTGLAATTWYTFTLVHRSTGWELYQDGVLVQTSSTAAAALTTSGDVFLATRPDTANFGNVDIGEARIWNYARSAADILAKYRIEITDPIDLANLYLYWKLNDGAGATVANSSTNVSASRGIVLQTGTGTVNPSPSWQSSPVRQVVFIANTGADSPGGLEVSFVDLGPALEIRRRISTSSPPVLYHHQAGIVQDRWYHVAVTRDGTNDQMIVYVDGLAKATLTAPQYTPVGAGTAGALAYGGSAGTYGQVDLDEVRIWTSVRTAAQIAANISNEIDPVPAALAAYYKLDGNANDSGAGAANGTLVGSPTLKTMAGGQIPLGIEDFATARRILRSAGTVPASEAQADLDAAKAAAEAGPFYLVSEIPDNSTKSLIDNTPDVNLAILDDGDSAGDPPPGRIVSTFGERLIVAGPATDPRGLYTSAPGELENFDIFGDEVTIEDSRSAPITAVVDYSGISRQAVVFTETNIFSLQDAGSRLEVVSIATGTGCLSALAAIRIDDVIYFWSRKGPQKFSYGGVEPLYVGIEKAVRDLSYAGYTTTGALAAFHHFPRKQIGWLVCETGSTPTAVYLYDYLRERWCGRHRGNLRAVGTVGVLTLNQTTSFPSAILADDLGYLLVPDIIGTEGGPNANLGNLEKTFIACIAGASSTTFVIGSSILPTTGDGLKNVGVVLVRSDGSEESRTISSNTATTGTISLAWTGAVPGAGDFVCIGPVNFAAESGYHDFGDPAYGPAVTRKRFQWLDVFFDNDAMVKGSDWTDGNGVNGVPVLVKTSVYERRYPSAATFETIGNPASIPDPNQTSSPAANDLAKRFFIPNGYGRFLRWRIDGKRSQSWGIHQIGVEYEPINGW